MKHTKSLLALLTILALLAGLSFAAGEETTLGSVPQRGLILPMTQEDLEMGLHLDYTVMPSSLDPDLPVLQILYTDGPVFAQLQEMYLTDDLDEVSRAAMVEELRSYSTTSVGDILLLEKEIYDTLTQDGTAMAEILGVSSAPVLGENDGHVYVCVDYTGMLASDNTELLERANAAIVRANELMSAATFQPLVFAEGEFDKPEVVFPAFSTTDLSGNPVTSDIFAGKDLTVVNIWGTFCGPCIDEMDELAAWSASMPENVQLVGLVSDLYSLEDTETLEMANLICESTGANNYLHLVTSPDFYDLMATVVGVPTTYFVDSTGAAVGQPIVGANVPACMAFVEEYLNGK